MITWQIAVYMLVIGVLAVMLAPLTNFWWGILLLGVAVPVALMVGRARFARDDRREAEARTREILGVIAEHGPLTEREAAGRIDRDVMEASILLEHLTRQGRLIRQMHNGVAVYALPGNAPPLARVRAPGLHNGEHGDPMALERGASPVAPARTSDGLFVETPGSGNSEVTRTLAAPADSRHAGSNHTGDLPDELMSEREREVLAVLASGRTTAEAARDLYISVGTVKSHTANIYRKLGARNRAEAISRARDLGLLS